MTRRDPALVPFDALIGTWATEATHPLFDAVVPGASTFEWFDGGHWRHLCRSSLGGGLVTTFIGFDLHRAQITHDSLDTTTGETNGGRIRPGNRETVRAFLTSYSGD